jgi:hypothetical protein
MMFNKVAAWVFPPRVIEILGRNFQGRDVRIIVPTPVNSGPGYYEYEWLQDGGAGVMFCGKVIRADSFQDAIENGNKHVGDQWHVSCCLAYGNMPERVRRLPEEMQLLTLTEAQEAWKQHPNYNEDPPKPGDPKRINPWAIGPVISGRSGL